MSQQKLSEIFDKPNSGYVEFEAIKPRIRQDLEMLGDVIQRIRPERVIELKENDQKSLTLYDKPKGLKKLTDGAQSIRVSFTDVRDGNRIAQDQIYSSHWSTGKAFIGSGINADVSNYDEFRLEFFKDLANSDFFSNAQEREEFKRLLKQKLTAECENETPTPDIG